MRSATPRSALAAAHEQSYGRPVDEQRQHRSCRQAQRESTGVGQFLVVGDRLVYDTLLGRGGRAIGRGRGAISSRARGVPLGVPRGGRAINTRGPARGLAVIDLRQAKEELVLAYVSDLLGYLCGRILDLFLAEVVLIGDLLDRLSGARRRCRPTSQTTGGATSGGRRGRGSRTRGSRGRARRGGSTRSGACRSTRGGACGRTCRGTCGSAI